MGIRRNITGSSAASRAARDAYIQGVLALKQEDSGTTSDDLGFGRRPGVPNQLLSTWELFVIWHVWAMNESTPPGSARNAAHSGPAFLPWHRWYLLLLEMQFQRVLGDPDFGLPYWNWAADGDRPITEQDNQPIWLADCMGGNGGVSDQVVRTGPFRDGQFAVRVESDFAGNLVATDRPLRRNFGSRRGFGLPTRAETQEAVNEPTYDAPDWSANSTLGTHRNKLEGWAQLTTRTPPNTHNLVHVWVGGDMGPATSPNDPVFFMNHCNVDRMWEAWRNGASNRPYVPRQSEPDTLFRHRLNDPLHSILTSTSPTPAQMMNVTNFYTYDTLTV